MNIIANLKALFHNSSGRTEQKYGQSRNIAGVRFETSTGDLMNTKEEQ